MADSSSTRRALRRVLLLSAVALCFVCVDGLLPPIQSRRGRRVLEARAAGAAQSTTAALTTTSMVSKFTSLQAGEDRATDFVLEKVDRAPLLWRPHPRGCGFGTAELTAEVVDPADVSGTAPPPAPREVNLVKSLLRPDEVDKLLAEFTSVQQRALSSWHGTGAEAAAAAVTHSTVLMEDGRVVCPELHSLLSPALEERIVPYVRARLGDERVVVADALIRAYRPEDRRQKLAPHFDVSSFATVIIPLNPGTYEGGLYIQNGASASARLEVDCRRFGSFEKGDVLCHQYDVMHGVEVSSGSRYSLVLWLADCQESVEAGTTPWLRGAAESGSPYAQFLYAEASRTGTYGVPHDLKVATHFLHSAAAQGHALSQHQLGMAYWTGRGVEGKSDAKCLELWGLAADAGLAAAQVDLAKSHRHGYLGLAPNEAEARRLYLLAARQGHPDAAAILREWG